MFFFLKKTYVVGKQLTSLIRVVENSSNILTPFPRINKSCFARISTMYDGVPDIANTRPGVYNISDITLCNKAYRI